MTFCYEDFEVGAVAQLGGHTFLKEEIIEFAGRYDPQPFHLSEAGGEASPFGGLIASGWNTCSAMMGILVRDMLSGHICRCTGYAGIVAAIMDAAATLRGG